MLLLLQHSEDIPGLQDLHHRPQHSEDLPGSLHHEEQLLHHHDQSPTTEDKEVQNLHRLPQHSEDLPGSLQHEEQLLHQHDQSPLLPTPTTEGKEVQVTIKSTLEAKLDKDKTPVHETSHSAKKPNQSTNIPDNLKDTKPKDSTAHNTANKHSRTDNVNHKPSTVENKRNKDPRNTAAHKHNSAFDKTKVTPIIDKPPDTTPDNPDNSSGNEVITNHPIREPSKSVGPDDDLDSLTKPKHTNSALIELAGLKEEKHPVHLETTDPDESSLDDLKLAQSEPSDLKRKKSAANKEKSELESSTHPPAPNTKNYLEVLGKKKHDDSGNLTEDDHPDEAEIPHPIQAKQPEFDLTKSTDPPDKDDESSPHPPQTNKSNDFTDPHNDPPDKPELCDRNGDNFLNLPKSTAPTDPLTEEEALPKNPPDHLESNEEKNDDPSETNEEFPIPPETDDLAAPD